MAGCLNTHSDPTTSSEYVRKNDKNVSLTVQSESMFELTFHVFIYGNMQRSALLFLARENAFFENS